MSNTAATTYLSNVAFILVILKESFSKFDSAKKIMFKEKETQENTMVKEKIKEVQTAVR